METPPTTQLQERQTYRIAPKWMILQVIKAFICAYVAEIGAVTVVFMIDMITSAPAFLSNATSNGKTTTINDVSDALGTRLSAHMQIYAPYAHYLYWIVFIGIVAWSYVRMRNYKLDLSPDEVLVRTKGISSKEQHIPYATIQNVVVRGAWFERIFGLAKVYIRDATHVIKIPGQFMENANKISNEITSSMAAKNTKTI